MASVVLILRTVTGGTGNNDPIKFNNQCIGRSEIRGGYLCMECEELSDDVGEGPLYECGQCGTKYTRDGSADGSSHRCPDCNKFGMKLADEACGQCGEGEVEIVSILDCPLCSQLVALDEIAGHISQGCR